jgi:hypothetical protein
MRVLRYWFDDVQVLGIVRGAGRPASLHPPAEEPY